MRSIKFRGKRIDNGEWVEGFYCHFENFAVKDVIYSDGNLYNEVDPETIGQFTGLKDKDGKEIWEGSIFKNKYGEGVIVWNELACCFKMDWIKTDLDSGQSWFPNGLKSMQVIGNIHDNPIK